MGFGEGSAVHSDYGIFTQSGAEYPQRRFEISKLPVTGSCKHSRRYSLRSRSWICRWDRDAVVGWSARILVGEVCTLGQAAQSLDLRSAETSRNHLCLGQRGSRVDRARIELPRPLLAHQDNGHELLRVGEGTGNRLTRIEMYG